MIWQPSHGRQFTIGRAFRIIFPAIGRNILAILVMVVLLEPLLTLLRYWIVEGVGWPDLEGRDGIVSHILLSGLDALDTAIFGGTVAILVVSQLLGRRTGFREAARGGLHASLYSALVLWPFALIWDLPVPWDSAVGMACCAAGIVAVTVSLLIVPSRVWEGEEGGIWRGLRLLKGNFLRISFLVTILLVAQSITGNVLPIVTSSLQRFLEAHAENSAIFLSYEIVGAFGRIWDVLAAVAYFLIRTDHEGVPVETVAKVFD
jgi:hypothetical protein